mmetsp:Transcript_123147/g.394389  ORF Transcript_123147/g.394389 Transcript_123147/m.394389 type:complete len:511 (-) Transcript_123147:1852-3384(-)
MPWRSCLKLLLGSLMRRRKLHVGLPEVTPEPSARTASKCKVPSRKVGHQMQMPVRRSRVASRKVEHQLQMPGKRSRTRQSRGRHRPRRSWAEVGSLLRARAQACRQDQALALQRPPLQRGHPTMRVSRVALPLHPVSRVALPLRRPQMLVCSRASPRSRPRYPASSRSISLQHSPRGSRPRHRPRPRRLRESPRPPRPEATAVRAWTLQPPGPPPLATWPKRRAWTAAHPAAPWSTPAAAGGRTPRAAPASPAARARRRPVRPGPPPPPAQAPSLGRPAPLPAQVCLMMSHLRRQWRWRMWRPCRALRAPPPPCRRRGRRRIAMGARRAPARARRAPPPPCQRRWRRRSSAATAGSPPSRACCAPWAATTLAWRGRPPPPRAREQVLQYGRRARARSLLPPLLGTPLRRGCRMPLRLRRRRHRPQDRALARPGRPRTNGMRWPCRSWCRELRGQCLWKCRGSQISRHSSNATSSCSRSCRPRSQKRPQRSWRRRRQPQRLRRRRPAAPRG